jgi:hypothetical protein
MHGLPAIVLAMTVALSSSAAAENAGPAAGGPAVRPEESAQSPPSAPSSRIELPPREEFDREFAPGQELTGDELYDRFLENRKRLRTVTQRGRVLSKDPGGNPQRVDFSMMAKDYRGAEDKAVNDVFARVMLRFVGPNELERSAYLFVHRDRADDDEFMYSPHRDRTMRVKLSGQSIAGTDFTFDDFLVHLDDLDDARYKRHPDETIDGVSVYVVESTMLPSAKTSYTRSMQYLEQEHYVPLRTRYWDGAGVETKQLTSPHASIKEFAGVWVATETTALDLLEQTSSTLHIDEFDPDPEIDDSELSISRLGTAQ